MVGVLGSAGAQDAIGGYRDNDVTSNLVNAKPVNPNISSGAVKSRVVKASSKVNWTQPKSRKLTL